MSEPQLYLTAAYLQGLEDSIQIREKAAYQRGVKDAMPPLYTDLLSVIDSILAEAGDERAPSMIARVNAVPTWEKYAVMWKAEMVQGWVDRLRGIRAALKGAQEYSMGIKAYCALHKANFPADEMCPHCAAALEAKE
jgi:hypothetical protein